MTRFLATISLIAAALFVLAILALHAMQPDIDPMVFGISFYALGNNGYLLGLALILVGISGIALSLALWPAASSMANRAGLVLLIGWGMTAILAGLFPLDAPGAPATPSGTIHGIMGMNFLLIVPALLLIERSPAGAGEPVRLRAATFWLAWLMLAAAVLLFLFNGPLYSLNIGGAIQRLYWVVLVLWLLCKSLQVQRRSAAQRGLSPSTA